MITVPEILALWDFQNPPESEQRFRRLLASCDPASAVVLTTQIARTFGLRSEFARCQEILAELGDPERLPKEALAWYWLERGRSLASATHPAEVLEADALAQARESYAKAIRWATETAQDYLVIDAMHMMVVVDREPPEQLDWNCRTIDRIHRSPDPLVKKWLGPLHNNVGYALHLDGRYNEALEEFALSRKAYEEQGDAVQVGIANWMVAWTYRVMGRTQEALELQLKNEATNDESGTPDFYVYDELWTLYTHRGDLERAEHYRPLRDKYAPGA